MASTTIPPELEQKMHKLFEIGQRAVAAAQEENRRLGIPNVYSIDSVIYYELPNGELSREDPFKGEDSQEPAQG